MSLRTPDLLFTAIAPAIWGSTYIVTTQYLPNFSPMTVAMLRALPAGLLLVMIVRQIPTGIWWMRIFILGALNISLFWSLLFISVYRLPGGVAATVGAVQPLMVVFISAALLGSPIRLMAVLGAICGTAGVALLVLTPNAALDPVGVAAGLAGAVSMAFGTVLTRKWQPPVPLLTFTAWQLAAGGLLLVPVALVFDPPIPMPTGTNVLGLAWLGLIGAGLTYFLWFRGISRLEPTVVSLLGFLSPGTAVLLGWLFLDQTLSALQIIGVLLVIGSIWLGQRSNRTPRARIACRIGLSFPRSAIGSLPCAAPKPATQRRQAEQVEGSACNPCPPVPRCYRSRIDRREEEGSDDRGQAGERRQ